MIEVMSDYRRAMNIEEKNHGNYRQKTSHSNLKRLIK
jgi:hypothetical protein